MGIPNVKRFRPFCPECKENFTLMAVLPKDASVDAYPYSNVKSDSFDNNDAYTHANRSVAGGQDYISCFIGTLR